MTIYTSGKQEKDSKDIIDPEVVTEPLTNSKKDDCEVISPKLIQVTYFPRNRRTCCVHLCLTLMVFLILTCAAIGAVIFYKHINKRTYSGVCGVKYFVDDMQGFAKVADASKMPKDEMPSAYVEENFEVSPAEDWEYLHTPAFEEVRETTVWHDFHNNYTAIVDHQLRRCNVMPLNRTTIAPPTDLLDLVGKLLNGYYYKAAKIIRQNLRLSIAIEDLRPFGSTIHEKCQHYESFWVEKNFDSRVMKRSNEQTMVYAMFGNHPSSQEIYKLFIGN